MKKSNVKKDTLSKKQNVTDSIEHKFQSNIDLIYSVLWEESEDRSIFVQEYEIKNYNAVQEFIEPNMLLGFALRERADWNDACDNLINYLIKIVEMFPNKKELFHMDFIYICLPANQSNDEFLACVKFHHNLECFEKLQKICDKVFKEQPYILQKDNRSLDFEQKFEKQSQIISLFDIAD